jgi:hypothetical protein
VGGWFVRASRSAALFFVGFGQGLFQFVVLVPCCFRWMAASVLGADMVRRLYLLLDQTLFWLQVHLSGRFGYVSWFI